MTVVPDGFVETVAFSGARRVGTLNGKIALEQNTGRLVVRDIANQERTIVDLEGLSVNDTDGRRQVKTGIAHSDGRAGNWVAKPGVDLKDRGI